MNGKKLQELQVALLNAYRSENELREMLRFELDVRLDEIAEGANLRETVFNLIDWAEEKGRLHELICAAAEYNKGNLALRAWVQEYWDLKSFVVHAANDAAHVHSHQYGTGTVSGRTNWCGERLIFTIDDRCTLISQGSIPADTQIEAPEGLSKTLNLTRTSLSWEDLKGQTSKQEWKGTYWIEEIEMVATAIASDETPEIMTSTFRGRGPDGQGRIFRPVLLKTNNLDEASFQLHFYFNEVIVPELVRGPGNIGEIFNLLRIATRMRWEVIEPFLKFRGYPERGPEVIAKVSFSLRLVELETEKYNVLEEFQEPNKIFNSAEQAIMNEVLAKHKIVKAHIDAAIEAENFTYLMQELMEARTLIIRAMELASRKYHELLAEDLVEIAVQNDEIANPAEEFVWQLPQGQHSFAADHAKR